MKELEGLKALVEKWHTIAVMPTDDEATIASRMAFGICSEKLQAELAKLEAAPACQPRSFDEWWHAEGFAHLPEPDEPPQHAYVARLAWEAASSTAQGKNIMPTFTCASCPCYFRPEELCKVCHNCSDCCTCTIKAITERASQPNSLPAELTDEQ